MGFPHPVLVTRRDNKDHMRILLYCHYTTISGWGVPPKVYRLSSKVFGRSRFRSQVQADSASSTLVPKNAPRV